MKQHQSKRQRREEIMARAQRKAQGSVGQQLSGPQGVGAPGITGTDKAAEAHRETTPERGKK